MTDREEEGGFLGRWARLKREARRTQAQPEGAVTPPPGAADPAATAPGPEEPEIDLSTLPPLESLGPDSDFSVFLRKGVPAVLRNAALRKAWTTDPVISTFREVADYDWDFNAPGYGQLLPTDDVQKLLRNLFSRDETAPPDSAVAAEEAHPAAQVATGEGREAEGRAPDVPAPPAALAAPAQPAMPLPSPLGAPTLPLPAAPVSAQPDRRDHLRLPERSAATPREGGGRGVEQSSPPPSEGGGKRSQDNSGGDEGEAGAPSRRRRHGSAAPR